MPGVRGSAPRPSAAETARIARLALGEGRLLYDHRAGAPNFYLAVWALVYAEQLQEAERYFDLVIAHGRDRGSAADFGAGSGGRCQVLVRQGHLAEAESEALGVQSTIRLHAIARAIVLSSLLHAMAERAPAEAAAAFLAEHGLEDDLSDTAMGSMLLFSRGHLRLATGDAARALAQEELARARRWGAPSALAFALRAAGLAEGGAEGIELLRASAAAVDGAAAYERARSLTALGAALRRAGLRRDAREPLREALDLADRCGALRLASQAREGLVASGARPRRAALRGRDALTPNERRVAQRAALTNREIAQALFVTARTVEGHLTQTYTKLGVCARQQLAAALSSAA